VQDVAVQLEGSANASPAPVELTLDDSGFVGFAVTGTKVSGEFRCSDCGYGAGRPAGAATVPDVWRHGLGDPASTPRGLTRAVAGALRPEYFPAVTGLLDLDSSLGDSRTSVSEPRRSQRSFARSRCGRVGERVRSAPCARGGCADGLGRRDRAGPSLDDGGERLEAVAVAAPRAPRGRALRNRAAGGGAPGSAARRPCSSACRRARVAEQTGATRLLLVPGRADGTAVSLELLRSGEPFSAEQRLAAELCAAQARSSSAPSRWAATSPRSRGRLSSSPARRSRSHCRRRTPRPRSSASPPASPGRRRPSSGRAARAGSSPPPRGASTPAPISELRATSPSARSPSPVRSVLMPRGCRRTAPSRPRFRWDGRRSASCSCSIPRARSPRRSSSRGSRRSASAPRTRCAPASGRGCSRSSSSAPGHCSR
jgi:hypothetical protein